MNPAQWQQPQAQAPQGAPVNTPWSPAPAPMANPAQYNAFGGGGGNTFAQARQQPQLVEGDGPAISFNPATQTEGGMIDNVWVRFEAGRAGVFDYKGKSDSGPAPAVLYNLVIVDGNTQQPIPGIQPQEKAWTVGKLDDFQPKKNGLQFWSPTGKTGFNKTSNWGVFTRAAVAAGIPAHVFDSGQVDSLNGLVAFVTIAKQDRGVSGGKDDKGDRGTLVITQLPGGGRVQVAPQGQAPAAPAMAPAPQQQPAPMYGQPQAQPMMAPPAMAPQPQAPPAGGADRTAAAQLLAQIMATNPTSKQAFNVALFQRAMMDAPLRDLVSSAQFQTEMMGAPLNLP